MTWEKLKQKSEDDKTTSSQVIKEAESNTLKSSKIFMSQ